MIKMIKDILLYASGGNDPFTGYYTVGSPITSTGSASIVLASYPWYTRLMIFIPSMTGTVQFITGNPLGSALYNLPSITSPTTMYLIYTNNQTVLVYIGSNWQVTQQTIIANYNIFMNGAYVQWNVTSGSTISAYIHFEFDDGDE